MQGSTTLGFLLVSEPTNNAMQRGGLVLSKNCNSSYAIASGSSPSILVATNKHKLDVTKDNMLVPIPMVHLRTLSPSPSMAKQLM